MVDQRPRRAYTNRTMSDDQFTELTLLMNSKFAEVHKKLDSVDGRLDAMDRKLDNHDSSFEKLFKRMDDGFSEVRAELATKASADQLNSVINLLDANIREHEKQEVERLAMGKQLERLDTWAHQLAEKTGVTLSYE